MRQCQQTVLLSPSACAILGRHPCQNGRLAAFERRNRKLFSVRAGKVISTGRYCCRSTVAVGGPRTGLTSTTLDRPGRDGSLTAPNCGSMTYLPVKVCRLARWFSVNRCIGAEFTPAAPARLREVVASGSDTKSNSLRTFPAPFGTTPGLCRNLEWRLPVEIPSLSPST